MAEKQAKSRRHTLESIVVGVIGALAAWTARRVDHSRRPVALSATGRDRLTGRRLLGSPMPPTA